MPYYIMHLPSASYVYMTELSGGPLKGKQYVTAGCMEKLIGYPGLGYQKHHFGIVTSDHYDDIMNKFKLLEEHFKEGKYVYTEDKKASSKLIIHFDIVWRDKRV